MAVDIASGVSITGKVPPHAGRDFAILRYQQDDGLFQSTRPVWGGTANMHKIAHCA